MVEPASGSRIVVGMTRERRWNEPGSEALVFQRPVLPFSTDFARPENETGEVSRAGWKLPGLPGPVTAAVDFGVTFVAGGSLELFEHVFRGVTKAELEAGLAYQYDFEQDPDSPETSFRMVYGYPPVDRAHVFGVKFSQIVQAIGDNAPIQSRLTGQAGQGSRIGAAEADAGNLGTWTGRPWIRGVMSDPSAGDIHVRVTRDVAGGGLRFKVEVTAGAPSFGGTEVDVVYTVEDKGRWQNLQDQAGKDVGSWGQNKEPVEIVWPGSSADHGPLAVNDTWVFKAPGGWTDPVPTYLTGQRFTSAHWRVEYRPQGAADWIDLPVDGGNGTVTIAWPLTVGPGNSSKYPSALDRDLDSTNTIQLARKHRSIFFQQALESHLRFELRLSWLGQQIGSTYQWRESVLYEFPQVMISGAARPAANPAGIVETLDLVAEGGPNGEAPLAVKVITPLDWKRFADLP